MTDPWIENAHGMARASISAFLNGDFEVLEDILDPEAVSAEEMASCCHVLVGMLSGAVTTRAADMDMTPLEYWSKVISKSIEVIGH